MHYSRIIRALHALTALTITFQMVISLVMDHPRTSRPMSATGGLFFRWHEWLGLAALAILVCGWAYRLSSWKRESQGRLFPWLSSPGRQALFQDLKQFLLLRWTSIPEDGALAGTVHGLGLLIAAAMVLTGGVIYFLLGPQDTVTPTVRSVMEVHSFLATFMWIYLCSHAFMGVWHQYMGHGNLGRMFRFWQIESKA